MPRSVAITLLFLLSCFTATAALASTGIAGVEPEEEETPLEVYVSMGVLDVDGINSATQSFTLNLYVQFRWHDPALAHGGRSIIRENLSDIQAPRFLLLNRQRSWSSLLNVVDISPDGDVLYRMRLWGDFSQIMRLQEFPLDTHSFEIPVVGLGYSGELVTLVQDPESNSFMGKEFSVADWTIKSWTAEPKPIEMIEDMTLNGFVFTFVGERISRHYFIKYIIPLILIVAMSWVVFWIDPAEGASQLGVSVTSVLTLIAYHIALTSKLPDISYLTRMDLFIFGSTLLVFSSLIEVVLTSRLATGGRLVLARWIDTVCRLAFPAVYAAIGYMSLIAGFGATM
jgi:hypothetical protein